MTDQQQVAPKKWRVNKEINISEIFSAAVLLAGLMTYANQLDKRITVLESIVKQQEQTDKRQDEMIERYSVRVENALIRLESKVDQLADKGRK